MSSLKNTHRVIIIIHFVLLIGLLSPYKSRFIYKAELVDMALDLIIEDFRPFAYSLGIERTKFASYRQKFRASHLDRGTIGLVLQMIDEFSVGDMRPDVCSILDKAGYPDVIKRFIFGKMNIAS